MCAATRRGTGLACRRAGTSDYPPSVRPPSKAEAHWLVFEETEIQRTQEFVLRWSPDHGHSFREIVRQQWNFSPPGTVRETEDYTVEIFDVTMLELKILPDKNGGEARGSLASLRLA